MSIQDGTIGNRKNAREHIALETADQHTLESLASKYNTSKSEILRWGLKKVADVAFSRIETAASEINNAVAKVKNGYQRSTQRVKSYFTEPEDIYMPAYALPSYAQLPNYR